MKIRIKKTTRKTKSITSINPSSICTQKMLFTLISLKTPASLSTIVTISQKNSTVSSVTVFYNKYKIELNVTMITRQWLIRLRRMNWIILMMIWDLQGLKYLEEVWTLAWISQFKMLGISLIDSKTTNIWEEVGLLQLVILS